MDYLEYKRKQSKLDKEFKLRIKLLTITICFVVGVLVINGLMFFK